MEYCHFLKLRKQNNNRSCLVVGLDFCIVSCLFLLFMPTVVYATNEQIIWQTGYDYVALTPIDKKDANNDHPVEFTQQDIFELLESIQLQNVDKTLFNLDFLDFFSDDEEFSESRLFNKRELVRLSKPVATALANANPGQDVTFSITSRHEQRLGEGSLSTAGRFFFSKGKLNLIIGSLRVNIEQKYRMSGGHSDVAEKIDYLKLKKFRLNTGARKSRSELKYTFATDASHQLKPYKNKFRNDWLLIDVDLLRKEIAQHKQKTKRKENVAEETFNLQRQTRQINEEQGQLKKKVDRLERLLQTREKNEAAASTVQTKSVKARSVEERLTELKKLYDKGIISEEIYKQKMKQILDDL